MGNRPHIGKTKAVAVAIASVLFAVASFSVASSLESSSFDPSPYQREPENLLNNQSFSLNQVQSDDQANTEQDMDQTEEAEDQEESTPDVSTDNRTSSTAYRVTDRNDDSSQSIVTPNGEGTDADEEGTGGSDGSDQDVPIVNPGEGDGPEVPGPGEGDDPGEGPGPDQPGDNPSDNPGGNDPTPTPDPDPDDSDPDPVREPTKLPPNSPGLENFVPIKDFPGEVVTNTGRWNLYVEEGLPSDSASDMLSFYKGEVLTEEKLLRHFLFYGMYIKTNSGAGAVIDSDMAYRLTSFGENFMVASFPEVVPEDADSITFRFRFRPNSEASWITQTVTSHVYDYKLCLENVPGQPDWNYYRDEGDDLTLNLQSANNSIISMGLASSDAVKDLSTKYAFTGWSESGNLPTETLYERYTLTEPGFTRLKMIPYNELGENFKGKLHWFDVTESTGGYFVYHTRIVDYTGNDAVMAIPQGVHTVKLEALRIVPTVSVPNTVVSMDVTSAEDGVSGLRVIDAFSVAEDNAYYSSDSQGLLLNKDGNKILCIPAGMAHVAISDAATDVHFSKINFIEELTFSCPEPPAMDNMEHLTSLQRVTCPMGSRDAYVQAFDGILDESAITELGWVLSDVMLPDAHDPEGEVPETGEPEGEGEGEDGESVDGEPGSESGDTSTSEPGDASGEGPGSNSNSDSSSGADSGSGTPEGTEPDPAPQPELGSGSGSGPDPNADPSAGSSPTSDPQPERAKVERPATGIPEAGEQGAETPATGIPE
ncbi:MAG: hypothetical protein Q4D06_03570 [Coriobacteriia bacterium]|nr:hypothetical protein [Coriobacteriia bacterium]